VRQDPNSLFGGELGMDHVGVGVRHLDEAQRAYTETLGFGAPQAGRLPNGLKNVVFYFADGTYLELMTPWDKEKADWLASFLEKTEGANFVLLSVYDIEETRAFLSKRGFALGASGGGRVDNGPEVHTDAEEPFWHTAFFNPSPLPGGRVGFIAYRKDRREKKLAEISRTRLARRSPHPNSAKRMQAVWMVVKDLEAARKAYEAVGMRVGRTFDDPRLGAKGVELHAGQGSILLLQPSDSNGKAAAFLARRGESIAGLSIEVISLEKATSYLAQKTGQSLAQYSGVFGQSILVGPELTHDVFLELYQPAAH
jgi:catechol 2,3-dioxygenase-like lactoylglutathione lyase family enzyme